VAARPIHAPLPEDPSTQPDHSYSRRVDGDLEGQDYGALVDEADLRRGPAGRPEADRGLLDDEVTGNEVADQRADGAAGEAG
jgi:hypothetical protein